MGGPDPERGRGAWAGLATAKEIGRSIPAPTIGDPSDELPCRYPEDVPTISTSEVAAKLGVSPRRVQAMARNRHIGRRVGRTLAFTPADVENMNERKPGRPRHAASA